MKTKIPMATALLGAWLIACPVQGAQEKLTIETAAVDLANQTVTITGVGFDTVNDTIVTLGNFGMLLILSENPTEIVASLPADLTPGGYLLTVTVTKGSSQTDEFDLTVPLTRTLIVSPVGSAEENGNALVSVVNDAAALPPSETDPVLVHIEPGLYDVGTQPISLPSFMDIQGSGPNMTRVVGNGSGGQTNPVFRLRANTSLRDLAIEFTGENGLARSGIGIPAPPSGTDQDIVIDNVLITGDSDEAPSGSKGIYVRARTVTRVRNVTIRNVQTGIDVEGNGRVEGEGLGISATSTIFPTALTADFAGSIRVVNSKIAGAIYVIRDGWVEGEGLDISETFASYPRALTAENTGKIRVVNSKIVGEKAGEGSVICLFSYDVYFAPIDPVTCD